MCRLYMLYECLLYLSSMLCVIAPNDHVLYEYNLLILSILRESIKENADFFVCRETQTAIYIFRLSIYMIYLNF